MRITALVVASALFMQNLDGTAVATALPAMAQAFGVPPAALSAAITSYLVSVTVFIPASGWVADRFGAKRVFLAAIVLFTLSSVACALSQSLGQLILARIVQGAGGAMMVPVGRLLLLRRARRDALLTATTWLSMPALLGPLLGPPLGGVLTDAWSWRAVFWINLPVGLVGLALAWWVIPRSEAERIPPPDLIGMALVGAALTAFMVGIETIGRGLASPMLPPLAIGGGLVLSWAAYRHCRRAPHPAIDFSLFAIPTFRAATATGGLFRMAAGAIPFLVPLTLQVGFGVSASVSGMVSLASALGSFSMRPMAGFVLSRFTMRQVLMASAVCFAAIMGVYAAMASGWPLALVFAVLLIGGLSRSLGFVSLGTLAYADIPPDRLSAATALGGVAQQLPKAVGVAIAAGCVQFGMLIGGHAHAGRADFGFAFLVLAIVVAGAVPLFGTLPRDAGEGIVARRGDKPAPAE